MRISAARFPAHLHDSSPPVHEDCTVSRRWLRFAYLVPGAAGLAVLLVETAVRGDFVANVGELFLAAVYYVTPRPAVVANYVL